LKVNFQNYRKSENLRYIFHNLLGQDIFSTDGEIGDYKEESQLKSFIRKSSKLNLQGLLLFVCEQGGNVYNKNSTFVDHINAMSNHIFDKAVESHEQVNFHGIMLRFTMDTFVE
jgi:hypothetical protein